MLKSFSNNFSRLSFTTQRSASAVNTFGSSFSASLKLKTPFRSFADASEGQQKSLFVGNLPWEATESDITEFFSKHGSVTSVKLMKDNQTGRPRGFAFVVFNGDIHKAVAELDGTELKGRALRVNEAKPPAPRDPNQPRGGRFEGRDNFRSGGGDRDNFRSGGGDRDNFRSGGGDREFRSGGDRGADRRPPQQRGGNNRFEDRNSEY